MIYFSVKYFEDNSNRGFIEQVTDMLIAAELVPFCVAKDVEQWGAYSFSSEDLMKMTFQMIDQSKVVLIDLTEKGVGIGIEAGYAYAKGIPIVVIAKVGSDISNTLAGIADEVVFYDSVETISEKLVSMLKKRSA